MTWPPYFSSVAYISFVGGTAHQVNEDGIALYDLAAHFPAFGFRYLPGGINQFQFQNPGILSLQLAVCFNKRSYCGS
jgi:hypothetical protein